MLEAQTIPDDIALRLRPEFLRSMDAVVKAAVVEFLLKAKPLIPNLKVLALDPSGMTLHIWVRVADDDEDTEDALLTLQSQLNVQFKEELYFDMFITQASEGLEKPPHYLTVELPA